MDTQLPLEKENSKTEPQPEGLSVRTINLDIHPITIIKYIAQKLDEEIRILDIKDPEILTAIVISNLGEWGLLDGSHFNVVLAADKILELPTQPKRKYRRKPSVKVELDK